MSRTIIGRDLAHASIDTCDLSSGEINRRQGLIPGMEAHVPVRGTGRDIGAPMR